MKLSQKHLLISNLDVIFHYHVDALLQEQFKLMHSKFPSHQAP